MSGLARPDVEQLIFGGEQGRRFTQDSPILLDVWIAFAERPEQPRDLIIIPDRSANSGAVALELNDRLEDYRQRKPKSVAPQLKQRERAKIAHLPGVVAANLYFDELIRLVLPATPWWQRRVQEYQTRLRSTESPYLSFPQPKSKLIKLLAEDMRRVEQMPFTDANKARDPNWPRPDLVWTARLAGVIAWYFQGNPAADVLDTERMAQHRAGDALPIDLQKAAQAFLALFEQYPIADEPSAGSIWRISLNRNAEPAVTRSTLACKADAARLLFNVSAEQITWAVADSGIDSRHPAFFDWRGRSMQSRVIKAYDFSELRESLSLDQGHRGQRGGRGKSKKKSRSHADSPLVERVLSGLKADDPLFDDEQGDATKRQQREGELREHARDKVDALFKRLKLGHDVDWALLEPFVQVDEDKGEPPIDHGTHVAGIIGADWPLHPDSREPISVSEEAALRELAPRIDRNSERELVGMCPNIRLVDLRVLRKDQRSDEFEVIAALQLVRYLNTRAGHIAVHGVNLSLSIHHDVANYACGQTPICEEVNQLTANGTVVVAAAGNLGHQRYELEGGRVGAGYNSISITDPGNATGAITVGATHRYRPHEYGVSYFSSRGPTGDGRLKPDLVAPGEKIRAPVGENGYEYKDGTSMAAPHVSGAAAILMARHSELVGRPDRVKQILCDTATDLGRERYFQGAGMLDVLRALQSV